MMFKHKLQFFDNKNFMSLTNMKLISLKSTIRFVMICLGTLFGLSAIFCTYNIICFKVFTSFFLNV